MRSTVIVVMTVLPLYSAHITRCWNGLGFRVGCFEDGTGGAVYNSKCQIHSVVVCFKPVSELKMGSWCYLYGSSHSGEATMGREIGEYCFAEMDVDAMCKSDRA